MSNLISITDIETITGLDEEELDSLIPYAEAQADAMLGFLHSESKEESIYLYDATDILQLESYPITAITSIKYRASAADIDNNYTADQYRYILDKGMIIFDAKQREGYTIKVAYTRGYTAHTIPAIVKLYLVVLTVKMYYSLRPDESQHSQVVVSEKIGDYAIKYADVSRTNTFKSLDEWADYLAMLVRKGGALPGSEIS